MELLVKIPSNFILERKYTLEVVFFRFLQIPIRIEIDPDISDYNICLGDSMLIVKDSFFSLIDQKIGYLNWNHFPNTCLFFRDIRWISENDLPVLFGEPTLLLIDKGLYCKFDVFATIFFFLSRWEEIISDVKDEHDRFPSSASFSGRFGLIDRPLVDEYIVLLQNMLRYLGFSQFTNKIFRIEVSCDVDWPYDPIYYDNIRLFKTLGGDLLKRRSFNQFSNHLRNKYSTLKYGYQKDPYYTFDFLMNCCEKYGHSNTFYFISGHSAGEIDGVYDLNMPIIQNLLKSIDERGHEIGIHFSYDAFKDREIMLSELENLKRTLFELGLKNTVRGSRQHFLRWETAFTPKILNDLGLTYDSSLAFADHVGFRSGTSHSYPIFDPIGRIQLNLIEIPLILMECSAISDRYMGMGYTDESLQYMINIKNLVKKYNGTFSMLWHNSHFNSTRDYEFFEELLK